MTHKCRHAGKSTRHLATFFLLAFFAMLPLTGCKQGLHTSDPRLRQIDETLNAQLPAGTPKSRVLFYLSSQGFPVENTTDPRVVAATVQHVDTETLKPVAARVTFHFDADDRLKSYELASQ